MRFIIIPFCLVIGGFPLACGKPAKERCYDECTTRAVLCHTTLKGDFSDKYLLCGQDLCYEGCDAKAAAVTAEQRARDERNR